MKRYAKDYSVDELMTVVLARELHDGDIGLLTQMCPLGDAAICLAKLTHAKELVWCPNNACDPKIDYTLDTVHNVESCLRSGVFIPDWGDMIGMFLRGITGFQVVAPAQIDKYGNFNNNVIGEHTRPRVRLPGSVGMPDMGCFDKKVLVYEPKHEKRVFVEKVDFIAGLGQVPGGIKGRRARGINGGGPLIVVSNLAAMDFDEETGVMRVKSIHPGVNVEQIQENTGFALVMPKSIPETEPPTEEQVELIRTKIDPKGQRRHRM